MYGGEGNDEFGTSEFMKDDATDYIYGGNGDDALWVMDGGFGNDSFYGGGGDDALVTCDIGQCCAQPL